MKTFQTTTQIQAAPERVWDVLTQEISEDPEPFGILKLEGKLALNEKLKLWSDISPNRAFSLNVTAFDAPRLMIWRGGMPFGLFAGTRTFTLSPTLGGTHFDMHEVFDGMLAPLITKSIPDLTPSFETFANALKERAERP